MNMNKIMAFLYMVSGFALIIVFGGKLIIQLLGMMAGFYMIWRGFLMLNNPMIINATFKNFTQDRFK